MTGLTPPPKVDEIMLAFGSSGRVVLMDILRGKIVWEAKETGLYRKVPMRAAALDAGEFTPDGTKIITVSVFGTISVYGADSSIAGINFSPVEQYFKFEFSPTEERFRNQQVTMNSS